MAGDHSELQRRAAAIAVESSNNAMLSTPHAHHVHDTDGDSANSSSGSTAMSGESASGHAPPSDTVHHTLKRLKLTIPPLPTSSTPPSDNHTWMDPVARTPRRSVGSESDGNASSSSSSVATEPPQSTPTATHQQPPAAVRKVRVRKPTYAVRKEEKEGLVKYIQRLEAQVSFLTDRAGVAAAAAGTTRSLHVPNSNSASTQLAASLQHNDALREALRQQQLGLARSQSAVLQCLSVQHLNPMKSFIRLGATRAERHATLVAIQAKKLRDAFDYVAARASLLNPLTPHVSDERFETLDGDFCCVRFETFQFIGLSHPKQVFDALIDYINNTEVSISEHLGDVTARDDFEAANPNERLSNHRLVSTEFGVEVELNGVLFTAWDDAHAYTNGAPCGIVVVDSVDDDALYPYAPARRIRKDISATCVITQAYRPSRKTTGGDSEGDSAQELVVVLTRGAFLRLHHSDSVVMSPQTQLEIRDNITRWGDAMLRCLIDRLHPDTSLSHAA